RPAVHGKLVRKILRVARTDDLCARVVTKQPGGKRDRRAVTFQRSRRQVNDQPLDVSTAKLLEFMGDHGDVPIVPKLSAGVQFVKAALDKSVEIGSHQRSNFLLSYKFFHPRSLPFWIGVSA